MQEICFCGREGELEDRELTVDQRGQLALRCPDCGNLDSMQWLDKTHRKQIFDEVRRRTPAQRKPAA